MDDIQMAQVAAAEDAVVQRLRKKGLLPPESEATEREREYPPEFQPDLPDDWGVMEVVCADGQHRFLPDAPKCGCGVTVNKSVIRRQLESALATTFVSMQATYNPGERQGYWLECLRLAKEIERLNGKASES